MSSAWNWIGILVWLLILAYLFWVVDNVHSRKKRLLKTALNNRKHELTTDVASRNFEITAFEVVILVILLLGMGKTTLRHHVKHGNSIVTSRVEPIAYTHTKLNKKHPFAKRHYYYVRVNRSRARDFRQNYSFMIDGQNTGATNANSVIVTDPDALKRDVNLAHLVSKGLSRKIARANRSHRAWAVRFVTRYRNDFTNGLGLHAGQKKFYYTLIKVPSRSGIYVDTNRLKSKSAKK